MALGTDVSSCSIPGVWDGGASRAVEPGLAGTRRSCQLWAGTEPTWSRGRSRSSCWRQQEQCQHEAGVACGSRHKGKEDTGTKTQPNKLVWEKTLSSYLEGREEEGMTQQDKKFQPGTTQQILELELPFL